MADFVIVVARVHLIVPDDIIVADALHAIHLIFVSELKSSDRSMSDAFHFRGLEVSEHTEGQWVTTWSSLPLAFLSFFSAWNSPETRAFYRQWDGFSLVMVT